MANENEKFRNGGPGSIGDLVRQGGDPESNMTDDDLRNYGPGFWPDMVRQGGEVIEEEG